MNVPSTERLSRYLIVMLRWLLITGTVFILTILGGNSIVDRLPKVYTATTQIEIRPQGITIMPPGSGGNDALTNFQAEFDIIRSPDFLLPVIVNLGLDTAWQKRVFQSKDDQLSLTDDLAYLNKNLKLYATHRTNIVKITAASDLPKEAADIANAVADRYKTLRDAAEPPRALANSGQQSPVLILSRAVPPEYPSKPNKSLYFVATVVLAFFLSFTVASFTEIVFLFLRAAERPNN